MGNVDKWRRIIILNKKILGEMMWIKMGINEGDNGSASFRLYKVRCGRWKGWCVDEAHSATTPGSLGVSGSI